MKLLFWKEWREHRMLPLMALMIYIAMQIVIGLFSQFISHTPVDFGSTYGSLFFVWLIFWIAAGSGTFAQEVGSGSLEFLSVMPVDRHRLWWVKTSSAVLAAIAVWAVTLIFWMLYADVVFHQSVIGMYDEFTRDSPGMDHATIIVIYIIWTVLSMSISVASGICASPFFDRALSAWAAAFVGGIFYVSIVLHQFQNSRLFEGPHRETVKRLAHGSVVTRGIFTNNPDPLFFIQVLLMAAIGIAPLLITSYQTFTRGEALKSPKKFIVGAISGVASYLVMALLFELGTIVKFW
jgi:hypothetical protein